MQAAMVLLNPGAAGGRAARLASPIRDWLQVHHPATPLVISTSVKHAQSAVQALPHGARVVVVGGDGTVHHLLGPLMAHQSELALVPMGSGNDCARALGLHRLGWQDALAHALQGSARPIDLGEVRVVNAPPRLFASSLAAGFDASVGLRATRGPRFLRGLPKYLWATLREVVALRNWTLHVVADGAQAHSGPTLFASVLNTPSYGSGMPIVPHARIDDGCLDLVVAGQFGRLGTLAMLPRLMLGQHLGHCRVSTHAVRTLQLRAPLPIPLATDGEPLAAATEFSVRIIPAGLMAVTRN